MNESGPRVSIKAYKYRLYANKSTTEKLQWTLDRCRELYNAGLQERRDAYEMMVRRHPGYYDEKTRRALACEHAVDYYAQKRELVKVKELRALHPSGGNAKKLIKRPPIRCASANGDDCDTRSPDA